MELMVVADSYSLLWPEEFENRYRGESHADVRDPATGKIERTGLYVVDMDAPLERDLFCAGQIHKLRPITDEERLTVKGPTAIEEPFALAKVARARAGIDQGPKTAQRVEPPVELPVEPSPGGGVSDEIADIPVPRAPQSKQPAQAGTRR